MPRSVQTFRGQLIEIRPWSEGRNFQYFFLEDIVLVVGWKHSRIALKMKKKKEKKRLRIVEFTGGQGRPSNLQVHVGPSPFRVTDKC